MRHGILALTLLLTACSSSSSKVSNDTTSTSPHLETLSLSLTEKRNSRVSETEAAKYLSQEDAEALLRQTITERLAKLYTTKPATSRLSSIDIKMSFERVYTISGKGVTIPLMSFTATGTTADGETATTNCSQCLAIERWGSIIDIYRVPFGLFGTGKEQQYLGLHAERIGNWLYHWDTGQKP